MITEDYVSFETAKLLKENGYKGLFNSYYNGAGCVVDRPNVLLKEPEYQYYERVSLYMAMKWLREIKGIAITLIVSSILDNEKFLWDVEINVAKTNDTYHQGWIYENYEAAAEKAIKYCLEHLI